jgi:hypothetical protein
MENLLKIGISQNTIDNMIESNSIFKVDELNFNYNNTNRILTTLKQLKISEEAIEVLLVQYIDLFKMDYNRFISKLRYADLNEVSFSINNDVSAVEDIFLN